MSKEIVALGMSLGMGLLVGSLASMQWGYWGIGLGLGACVLQWYSYKAVLANVAKNLIAIISESMEKVAGFPERLQHQAYKEFLEGIIKGLENVK